jgi:cobalt/nickel transport system permease protein
VTGQDELKGPEQGLHAVLAGLQKKLAFLPDYGFKKTPGADQSPAAVTRTNPGRTAPEAAKSSLGTSVAGLVGGMISLGLAILTGFVLRRKNKGSQL